MPINPDLAGHSYPPTPAYTVCADEITAFAQAVGARSPLHSDAAAAREAGYADVIAPPTFALRIAQRAERELIEDPQAGIDFDRVVHGEQCFVHTRPIFAGDELTAQLHVDAVRSVGGHSMVTSRCELTDREGNPVTTAISMLVVRGEEA